jgi:hypothetical protein
MQLWSSFYMIRLVSVIRFRTDPKPIDSDPRQPLIPVASSRISGSWKGARIDTSADKTARDRMVYLDVLQQKHQQAQIALANLCGNVNLGRDNKDRSEI